jgi:hypothetical protein
MLLNVIAAMCDGNAHYYAGHALVLAILYWTGCLDIGHALKQAAVRS